MEWLLPQTLHNVGRRRCVRSSFASEKECESRRKAAAVMWRVRSCQAFSPSYISLCAVLPGVSARRAPCACSREMRVNASGDTVALRNHPPDVVQNSILLRRAGTMCRKAEKLMPKASLIGLSMTRVGSGINCMLNSCVVLLTFFYWLRQQKVPRGSRAPSRLVERQDSHQS